MPYHKCYYNLMSRENSKRFREECLTNFGWSENTFYNRLRGNGFAGPYEEREFVRILKKYYPNF